jgi:DNA replication and repair protein RecF
MNFQGGGPHRLQRYSNFASPAGIMLLTKITIENFKSYTNASIEPATGINCLTGHNGAGKTNLLDAVYYLCTGKSYFNAVDQQLIKKEENYFSIRGSFNRNGSEEDIHCVLVKGRKKVIKRNEVAYERLAEHYGEFPAVMVSPGDMELISGGSEDRRRWLDSVISIVDKEYLYQLMRYDKVLLQRNTLLKKLSESREPRQDLLAVLDEIIIPLAEFLFEKRKEFIEEFIPVFREYHHYISNEADDVEMSYVSDLSGMALAESLAKNFRRDIALQRTSSGTHKDELEFMIDGSPLKKFGSQGQQKTFLMALKLGQHQFIKRKKSITPLLLLDDVSERLDENRLRRLFALLEKEEFGQVFMSDTSSARISSLLQGINRPISIFELEDGEIKPHRT